MLKELDRHTAVLSQISQSEGVDNIRLEKILMELQTISKELYSASGKIGNSVMKNDIFLSVTQRSSIPGSTCCFDLPAFHFWLEQNPAKQNHDLEEWIKPFRTIRNAIKLVLNFIRQSSTPTPETAVSGFFQANLDNNMSYQLLRISTERSLPYYAEISGGKHRFSVRFMLPSSDEGRAIQSSDDIPFQLTCCLF
jgi:cell division protein ZapD